VVRFDHVRTHCRTSLGGPSVKFATLTVGPFRENSYVVVDDTTNRAVLIDPGDEPERLIALVEKSGATLDAIWLTHGHLDHIGGIAGVRRRWPVPVYLHAEDLPLYERAEQQAAMYGVSFEQPEPPEHTMVEGDVMRVGELEFDVLHTPGHSPGHVIFKRGDIVFGGDLLFAGSIGRTDLPLSDAARMEESLARICEFDDATVFHPGHGPRTTLGQERATNGFLNGAARILRR
jgi:glyoxylase-like metal-dependent hydrolase (beta-lactamase superfamily II)